MPHREKLTTADRRELVLEMLSGISPTELSRRYGVATSYVYNLTEEAKSKAHTELEAKREEVAFLEKVRELL